VPTFRTNDGVNLSYVEEGQGRPVVLIHGYTAPAAAWALTTDALVTAGYRVIAFDRRSHG
jgi:non-heme chloroperoxidase